MSRPEAISASSGLVNIRESSGFTLAARRDANHNVAVQMASILLLELPESHLNSSRIHERWCTGCGYPVGGAPVPTRCPECGGEQFLSHDEEDAARSLSLQLLRSRTRRLCCLAAICTICMAIGPCRHTGSTTIFDASLFFVFWFAAPIAISLMMIELTSRFVRAPSAARSPTIVASICFAVASIGVLLVWTSYEMFIAPALHRGVRRPSTGPIVFVFIPPFSVALGAIAAIGGAIAVASAGLWRRLSPR